MDSTTYPIFMLVALFAVMYFLMIRPENKRKKQAQEMRDSLKKGDIITSIGGIVGRIVQVNADTVIIETSEDRVRMEIAKWGVSSTGVQSGDQPAIPGKKKNEKAEELKEPREPELPASEKEEKE